MFPILKANGIVARASNVFKGVEPPSIELVLHQRHPWSEDPMSRCDNSWIKQLRNRFGSASKRFDINMSPVHRSIAPLIFSGKK